MATKRDSPNLSNPCFLHSVVNHWRVIFMLSGGEWRGSKGHNRCRKSQRLEDMKNVLDSGWLFYLKSRKRGERGVFGTRALEVLHVTGLELVGPLHRSTRSIYSYDILVISHSVVVIYEIA